MTRLTIQALAFPSFLKLCALTSFALGLFFGVVAFIASLLDANVRVQLLVTELTGIAAGIAAIPVAPILLTMFGVLAAPVAFLPFKWLLRAIGGIDVTGDWVSAAPTSGDEALR